MFNNKNKLKKFILLFFLLFLFVLISAVSYANAVSSDLQNSVFRLHVIANSNSEEDQNLKYIVRDSILQYINKITNSASSKQEVIQIVSNNIDSIQEIAQKTIYENGFSYSVTIDIGNFLFPTKTYGDISFPAGYYDALKIKIGEAKGNNWWCVMFPPLCFIDVTSGVVPDESKELLQDSLLEEEYNLISNDNQSTKLKFKLVEMFQNITAKLSS